MRALGKTKIGRLWKDSTLQSLIGGSALFIWGVEINNGSKQAPTDAMVIRKKVSAEPKCGQDLIDGDATNP